MCAPEGHAMLLNSVHFLLINGTGTLSYDDMMGFEATSAASNASLRFKCLPNINYTLVIAACLTSPYILS